MFVGDTFCYLSGITFATVGILGHFSKTLLLFFIPQIINFIYSFPQLLQVVPCPRHRMPKYNPETNLLEVSKTVFKLNDLSFLGKFFVKLFRFFKIIKWEESADGIVTTNNFTIINFMILVFGPTHEKQLTNILIMFQILCSLLAFTIRYPLAIYFYDN